METIKLKIINSTVRPERKGMIVTAWIAEKASKDNRFDIEIIDLKEQNLPLMDESVHPSQQKYQHQHTKDWSAKIEEADAFIFVTAEYNYGYPSPLRNALEFLVKEWAYKAGGIVSYGGVSAGTRAANKLKDDLTTLKIVPIMEMVNIPFFNKMIDADDKLQANDVMDKAAENMLKEIARWTKGLKIVKAG